MAAAVALDPIVRLTRDLATAAKTLSDAEARFLVDTYYQMQANRIRSAGQVRSLEDSPEPHDVLDWLVTQSETLENQIKRALDKWTDGQIIGQWLKSITGIGPVLASGLIAHTEIDQCPTVGHLWRFAGLDPSVTWGKGQKRPWNAGLKVLCWKVGESFVKVQNLPSDTYGQVYVARKAYEQERNERGGNAEAAKASLEKKKFGKETESYKHYTEGKLPDIQIHRRAQRYAVKLFLAHFHEVYYFLRYQTLPPFPYALAYLGHAHKIDPPNTDMIEGWPGSPGYPKRKWS